MKPYRFIDWATQLYVGLVGLLVLLFHGQRVPGWGWVVAAHALCMVAIHGVVSAHASGRGGAAIRFLRAYYPILLYTGFYRETGLLNHLFLGEYVDPVFMRADQVLFGMQPSLVWMERLPFRWLAEILYGCYFSYYFMIAGLGLYLLFRDRRQFDHFVAVISFVFYACYLTYIALPVMGPRIYFGEEADLFFGDHQENTPIPTELLPERPPLFPDAVQAAFFYRVVIWIYRHFEAPGAAFPSSHVAVSLATLYFTWVYVRRMRWVHTAAAVGLCLSTVYCRYHYVVDVLAGMLVVVTLVPLGNWLYARFDRPGASGPPRRSQESVTGRS